MKNIFLASCLCFFLDLCAAANAQNTTNPNLLLFSSEVSAQTHCPADTVMWLDNRTNIYYAKGQRWYGKTLRGSFLCKQDAKKLGVRPTKNGQLGS